MDFYQNSDSYLRVTEIARQKQGQLEKAGYLHSNYDRFKDISDYDSIIYGMRLNKVARKLLDEQAKREQAIYQKLGVKNVQELQGKFFSDEAIANFIGGHFNNIYTTVADALKDVAGKSDLSQKISKVNKVKIEQSIEDAFNKDLEGFSEEYQDNLSKIVSGGTLGENMVSVLNAIDNRTAQNKMKTGAQVSRSALAQWKGALLENCLAMFIAQLGNVDKVEITGSSLDTFGKFVKSDVTAHLDDLTIGFQAKNYKWEKDPLTGNIKLPNDLTLHGGGSFESFLQRIESLKNQQIAGELKQISKSLRSDNYYYHLINEAVNKTNFKSSAPAQEFLQIVQSLAAAWFGAQLLTDTQQGTAGQNVDFLIVSNIGFIPMSVLLRSLYEQAINISTTISSKANIDEENIYQQKISSPYTSEGLYSHQVQNIGYYAGQEVYGGITVGAIKLQIVLNNLK